METKVVKFEDENIQYVKLSRGTYLVDGNVVEVGYNSSNKVAVKNSNDIRILTENRITTGYTNGEITLTNEEYRNKREKYLENADYDEYDECYKFQNLEDEYEYKKFNRDFKAVAKNIQEISEPIKVYIEKVNYHTGNKYIKSEFLNGTSEDNNLFVYDRRSAWLSIVSDCFDSLDMAFAGDISYEYTKHEKKWGNSSHSCIRYVTAFGSYVFNDKFDTPTLQRGTLEDMKQLYEKDKKDIENIIHKKYNMHFGKINIDDFDFDKVLEELKGAARNLLSVTSIKRTQSSLIYAKQKINNVIEIIESMYREEK